MAWIESHTVLLRHRKLRELAVTLGELPVTIMGHLHALWHSALEQQEDGDLSAWSDSFIAEAASYNQGDPSEFVKALQKHGWLDQRMIHDWLNYAGRYLESKYRTSNPARLVAIWAKRGVKPKTDYSPSLVAPPTIPTRPNQDNQPTHIGAGAIEVLERYKKLKGVPADQGEQWDVKLRDRMLPYAKNILATCKDVPNAIRCLDQYAREFEQRGFKNWTLKAIDDRAIEWMAQKEGGSREQRARTGQGFLAEMRKRSAVENEDPDHGSFATAGQVFNKPRDRSPAEHPNAASRDERERVAANERSVGRLRTEPLEAKADRREKP